MSKYASSRVVRLVLVCLLSAVVMTPGCAIDAVILALNGTYNLSVTSAASGSLLPVGTTGPVIIANGLLTSWLGLATTNPQNPTTNGTQITWKATIADPSNPFISTEVTLTVINQGGGTLSGEAFFTILGVATPASQVTLQLQ